jgi:putative flavoprotein involved in K+ transport
MEEALHHFNFSKINPEFYPIVIIGAGVAGLCSSLQLTRKNIPHIIIEKGEIANTWTDERWDNFFLVNPNWAIKIPEFGFGNKSFPSKNPNGFLNKSEVINLLNNFASHIGSKIFTHENVISLSRKKNDIYKITTNKRKIHSNIIIIASGAFGDPHIPKFSSKTQNKTLQIHSSQYKNSKVLPEGAVLVVGSGQSGAQITEDLLESGKKVWLSVSKCGRRLRSYRGHDSSWWNNEMGFFDKTVKEVPFNERWKCSSHTSGARGGHEINLMDLQEKGLNLCGSVSDCSSERIFFNKNLFENLKFSDDSALKWSQNVDEYIQKNNIQAPSQKLNKDPRIIKSNITSPENLSFNSSNISTIIWATGFRFNFDWIKLDVTEENGHPIQKRGITKFKGLYFMGLQWMYSSKSAQFIGVGEDAKYVVSDIYKKFNFN